METIKELYAHWDSAVLSTARVGLSQCSKHRYYRIALEFGAMRARIAYERLDELITIRSAIARCRETTRRCAGSSAAFLPPSPPAEKASAPTSHCGAKAKAC